MEPPVSPAARSRRSLLQRVVGAGLGLAGAAAARSPLGVAARELADAETHPKPGCQPVVLVLGICPGTATGLPVSTFNGAPVTVRDKDDQVIFAGFVPSSGNVVVGTVQSNKSFTATIGAVLQPVPFVGGGADFVEMTFSHDGGDPEPVPFKPPCEEDGGGGGLLQISFNQLEPSDGEIRGRLLASCGSTATVPNVQLTLLTTKGNSSPDGPPHKAKKVATGKTTGAGIFRFRNLDPCQSYRLRFQHEGLTREIPGLLAGAPKTTIGTPSVSQVYFLNAGVTSPTDGICDVFPDPP